MIRVPVNKRALLEEESANEERALMALISLAFFDVVP
jgi:hypothetical protein